MRVAFAGTPAFAAIALEAIAASGHDIPLVLTQPDRPAGRRGLRLTPSAVADAAGRLGLTLIKPSTLRDPAAQELLRDSGPDILVVAAYGLMLPAAVLATPRKGCINIHASLLPRWRGAAPIQRAILAGDATTGITIMRMDEGLDTGPVLLAESLDIEAGETAGGLTGRLAQLGARLVVKALSSFEELVPVPQDPTLATHAPKVAKAEAVIDWAEGALAIERRVRAFNPAPGAEARFADERIKIWEAEVTTDIGAPGEILSCDANGIVIGCGRDALLLRRVQRPGGRPLAAADFARGVRLSPGAVLEGGPAPSA